RFRPASRGRSRKRQRRWDCWRWMPRFPAVRPVRKTASCPSCAAARKRRWRLRGPFGKLTPRASATSAGLGQGRPPRRSTGSTVSPGIARKIAEETKALGLLALDAPVSGGQAGAENGKLSIMCGGAEEAMEAARPVLETYAARIVHIGEAGAGQAAKAVNQICIAGVLAGLSEGLRFAQAAELDLEKVLEAISGGAAQSWQMENRWATMAAGQFDFGLAVDCMRRGVASALADAGAGGLVSRPDRCIRSHPRNTAG